MTSALRAGDLPAAFAAAADQERLGTQMAEVAAPRNAAAAALARQLGLTGEPVTLAALARALPEPLAADVTTARAALAESAGALHAIQARNANLVAHLRSFFRGVFAEFGAAPPARYGPSGRVDPAGAGRGYT